ncbi:MAG: ATP-binding protein [Candidatus Geothermincolia bacterium]
MRQLVILSGKGGTGKTTVAASLAQLLAPLVVADCDVEAPNLHLLLSPKRRNYFGVSVSTKAQVSRDACTGCGRCWENCRFGAIAAGLPPEIDRFQCEGCGLCKALCPADAIDMTSEQGARLYVGRTSHGPMVGGELSVGEEASGKVVARVRAEAVLLASRHHKGLILIDGPPGTGCPVIASLSGCDLALLVTEPSVAARHDLERIAALTEHFGIPTMVCINRSDMNPSMARRMIEDCAARGLPVEAEIPFRMEVVRALRQGCAPLGMVGRDVEAPLRRLAAGVRAALDDPNQPRGQGGGIDVSLSRQ